MISLEMFPCSGGMAEGFRRAGLVFTWAFDKDPNACASYEANHGHRPVQMDVHDLARLVDTGWRPAALDLIVADPPCTPWSRAGKRMGTEDERDCLLTTIDLIRQLRPRAYLIGNVPGLDDSSNWPIVQRALAPLGAAGYCIADYASLDAADYGVPQHRVRPFWFGHLAGPCIRWPAPTHGAPTSATVHSPLPGFGLKPWVTCRDALQHLRPDQLGRPVRLRRKLDHDSADDAPARTMTAAQRGAHAMVVSTAKNHPESAPDAPARCIKTNGGRASQGGAVLLANDRHRPNDLDEPSQTLGAKIRGNGPQSLRLDIADAPARTVTAKTDRVQNGSPTIAWPWDRPCTTVTARDTVPPPGHHPETGSILSLPNAVVLSELAATILQGFPETWVFAGATKGARWSQLGQAMPPPLAEAVARAVVEQMAARGSQAA